MLYEAIASRAFAVWLGVTLRRWLALVSFVVGVAGSVAFLTTEHIAGLLLVVLGLSGLVVVLGSQQYDAHRAKRQELLALDRLIADGWAIFQADEESLSDWPDWVERVGGYLLAECGLQALYEFRRISDGYDPLPPGEGGLGRPRPRLAFSTSRGCLKVQLAGLERLRRDLRS